MWWLHCYDNVIYRKISNVEESALCPTTMCESGTFLNQDSSDCSASIFRGIRKLGSLDVEGMQSISPSVRLKAWGRSISQRRPYPNSTLTPELELQIRSNQSPQMVEHNQVSMTMCESKTALSELRGMEEDTHWYVGDGGNQDANTQLPRMITSRNEDDAPPAKTSIRTSSCAEWAQVCERTTLVSQRYPLPLSGT